MLDLDSNTPSVTVSEKNQCALSTLNACKMHLLVTINGFCWSPAPAQDCIGASALTNLLSLSETCRTLILVSQMSVLGCMVWWELLQFVYLPHSAHISIYILDSRLFWKSWGPTGRSLTNDISGLDAKSSQNYISWCHLEAHWKNMIEYWSYKPYARRIDIKNNLLIFLKRRIVYLLIVSKQMWQ